MERITRPSQYATVYDRGRSWAGPMLVVRAVPNRLEVSRYGMSVSKRVGGAVVRNRVRRRLREIVRHASLRPGWDFVLIARPPSASASYEGLQRQTEELLKRAHILAGGTTA